jgi:hypothetical protein
MKKRFINLGTRFEFQLEATNPTQIETHPLNT